MRIARRMRRACAARPRSSTGGLCLFLPDQFAGQAILQGVRQVEAGQFPGPVRECEADAELARDRKVDRKRNAELADAVVGGKIKLQRIAERVQIQPLEPFRPFGEHFAWPAVLDEVGQGLRREQFSDKGSAKAEAIPAMSPPPSSFLP